MLGFVALYFALTFVVFTLIGGDVRALSKLADHGRRTTGVVRSIQLGRSWSVTVEFETEAQHRAVQSRFLGKPNQRLSELRVGQSVLTWFLPEDPDTASVGN